MGVLNINGVSNNESFKHLFEMQTLKSQIFVHMLWRDVWKCSPTHIQNFWRYFLRPWIRCSFSFKKSFFHFQKISDSWASFCTHRKTTAVWQETKNLVCHSSDLQVRMSCGGLSRILFFIQSKKFVMELVILCFDSSFLC